MHAIHVAEGVVLGKRGVGESHTLAYVLTEELGLVRARAQSARAEKSKLRFGLEPLTLGRFSFVRGRSEWRLVGVERVSTALGAPLCGRTAMGRVSRLLLRLVHGEEPATLYRTVEEGFAALKEASALEAEALECVLVLRILAELGYVARTSELEEFLDSAYDPALALRAAAARASLVRTINESLHATGL